MRFIKSSEKTFIVTLEKLAVRMATLVVLQVIQNWRNLQAQKVEEFQNAERQNMQNLKLYTKSEVMKMALEIEANLAEIILDNVDEPIEGIKMLLTANRFKSAIYERLGLSQEEFPQDFR